MHAVLFLIAAGFPAQDDGQDNLAALVGVLKEVDDASFHLDILRGVRDGLKGRQRIRMPKGWKEVSAKLSKSSNAEVRELVRTLSTAFGDVGALKALRATLSDGRADTKERLNALDTLLGVHDEGLPPILLGLLGDKAVRGASIRALAAYNVEETPAAILGIYPNLNVSEQRDAVNTLASRKGFAKRLIKAVDAKKVNRGDLTAATARQLRAHGDAAIDKWIDTVWGRVKKSSEAKQKEIARVKEMLLNGPKGDTPAGRAIFMRTCMQCHTLFGVGGKVGPELTGANRSSVDYLLGNILDPSAVVGKDYQATTIRTKDYRVISGIIRGQNKDSITILTENDTIILPRGRIDAMKTSQISMMPEGLFNQLDERGQRNLIGYLQSPFQVDPPAGQASTKMFNGKDLTGWKGDPEVWSVDNGEIVGRGPQKKNQFLYCDIPVADFRFIFEIKLIDNKGNSGIQFRSQRLPDGHAKGYQADAGPGWWGKLYHEHGRRLLWKKPGDEYAKRGEWNTYEILAVGSKIRTAINGNVCVDMDDGDKADLKGLIAFQVHSGGPMEVRFRNFRLEHNPEFKLKTKK